LYAAAARAFKRYDAERDTSDGLLPIDHPRRPC